MASILIKLASSTKASGKITCRMGEDKQSTLMKVGIMETSSTTKGTARAF
jgi:hypothetical protein